MQTAVGLDPSWTGFAVVAISVSDDGDEIVKFHRFSSPATKGGKKKSSKSDGTPTAIEKIANPERMDKLVASVFEWMGTNTGRVHATAIEGYSFGSEFGREKLGELGGFVRWKLWINGMSYRIVPPTSLKMFLTGSGKGKKDEMMMHTFKRWGFEAPNNDVCDAYIAARLALASLNPEPTKALAKVLAGTELIVGRVP